MRGKWKQILERYGQTVTLCRGEERTQCRAFLQPVRQTGTDAWQHLPTPLGQVRRDRWIYLGDPEVSLEGEAWLLWQGRRFDIRVAHHVCVGEQWSHWWALLEPGEEA